jgi:hypothetical protein
MRRVGDHYEYILVYVDDLGIASKDPAAITTELQERYGFQLKGTGPTTFHLGTDYFRDKTGTMCMEPKKYIEKMIDSYERMFGSKPKQYSLPLEHGDHPEIDTAKELEVEDIKRSRYNCYLFVPHIQSYLSLSSFRFVARVSHSLKFALSSMDRLPPCAYDVDCVL